MHLKLLSKRGLLIVILFELLFFMILLFIFFVKNSAHDTSGLLVQEQTKKSTWTLFAKDFFANSNQEQANVGLPARLTIPVISVDAVVIPVGLTSDGAMDVPKDPAEVAWYSLGPRPGEKGSAVIAGHYDWINNESAVFDNLSKLSKGDKIFVEDENGETITFVVREIRTYGKDDDASDVFGSDDDKAHLNLITCTGVWNKAEKTYSERLIVFTDKE